MTTAKTHLKCPVPVFHSHKNLVYSQLRYFDAWLQRHREDLVQAGMLGLWEAVNSNPMTFFRPSTAADSFAGAMSAYIRSEQKYRRHVVAAFVSIETQTNDIELATDKNAVTSLQPIVEREEVEGEKAKQNRLD